MTWAWNWQTVMWVAVMSTLILAVLTARRLRRVEHHEQHHCEGLRDLEDLIVALDDTGVVLPDHLREVADWVRERQREYDESVLDDFTAGGDDF